MNYKIDMPKAYTLALHTTMLTISYHLAVRIEVIPFRISTYMDSILIKYVFKLRNTFINHLGKLDKKPLTAHLLRVKIPPFHARGFDLF